MLTLILATAIGGPFGGRIFAPRQSGCPGGVCPVQQSAPNYIYTPPAVVQGYLYAPVVAAPAKLWFNLTNEPGWQGYGALNSLGQVVVEQRRPRVIQVAAPPPACCPVACPCCGDNCQCVNNGDCGKGGCACRHASRPPVPPGPPTDPPPPVNP